MRGMGSVYAVSVEGRTIWKASKSHTFSDSNTGIKRRQRITGTGATKQEALKRLDERMAERGGGLIPSTQMDNQKKHRFGDWFYEWIDRLPPEKVSDIVAHGYKRKGERYLLPHLGDAVIEEMEPYDLKTLMEHTLPSIRKDDGTSVLSSSSLLNVYRVLQMCLTEATRNPKIGILVSPLATVPAPKRNTKQESLGAIIGKTKGLIKYMEEENHPDYCRFLFQWLGLRRSERLGLSWSNVRNLDNKNATIKVAQQLARYQDGSGWYLKPPKTVKSERIIPLAEPFLSVLRSWKKQQEEFKKSPEWNPRPDFSDLVFLRPNGKFINQNEDNEDWHALLTEYLGEGQRHWRGHLNRHITATLLAEKNVSPAIAMEILGHASEAMTRYYTNITITSMRKPLEDYGEALGERTAMQKAKKAKERKV